MQVFTMKHRYQRNFIFILEIFCIRIPVLQNLSFPMGIFVKKHRYYKNISNILQIFSMKCPYFRTKFFQWNTNISKILAVYCKCCFIYLINSNCYSTKNPIIFKTNYCTYMSNLLHLTYHLRLVDVFNRQYRIIHISKICIGIFNFWKKKWLSAIFCAQTVFSSNSNNN